MKKLVYILVAVFTMVSVNANANVSRYEQNYIYRLHYCYPGGNELDDSIVNETVYRVNTCDLNDGVYITYDVYDESICYADEAHTKVIDPQHPEYIKIPTCKGYKFLGYFHHEKSSTTYIYYDEVIKENGFAYHLYNWGASTYDLYAHWEKDTKNFIWKDDGSGFYERDEFGHKDKNSFIPWNHMVIDKIPHTYLYLHYAYPGCNKEVVNQTIYVDESSFNNRTSKFNDKADNMFRIQPLADGVFYKDETKKEVVDNITPTCKGYKFVAYNSENYHKIIYKESINTARINEWHYLEIVPTPHLYGHWEKDTENYVWERDGSGFYEPKNGSQNINIPNKKTFRPWDYMKDEETTTDINEVEVSNEVKSNKAEGIYTLNGVKVNEITKSGIYIVNGKKVVK